MAVPDASAEVLKQPHYPFFEALRHGVISYSIKGVIYSLLSLRAASEWWKPSPFTADLVKTYKCRPSLPIRVFYPKGYERNSKTPLPTVFTIHGGGFIIGDPMDDDAWNRRFADMQNVIVVGLNYRKAPGYPFPTPTYDLEALLLAAYADEETLPIDKSRIALCGFSAGGALSLSVAQLPSIRETVKPTAVIPVYPTTDQTFPTIERAARRRYKTSFAGQRGKPTDYLTKPSPHFKWSYLPYGQDLRDPLLSPLYAARDTLPAHVFVVAAELDQLSHEAWRLACKLAGKHVPTPEELPGQEEPATEFGKLILNDERFYFEHEDAGQGQTARWLLVPDVVHGFDHLPLSMQGDQGAFDDSKAKTLEYQQIVGDWLHGVVWKK